MLRVQWLSSTTGPCRRRRRANVANFIIGVVFILKDLTKGLTCRELADASHWTLAHAAGVVHGSTVAMVGGRHNAIDFRADAFSFACNYSLFLYSKAILRHRSTNLLRFGVAGKSLKAQRTAFTSDLRMRECKTGCEGDPVRIPSLPNVLKAGLLPWAFGQHLSNLQLHDLMRSWHFAAGGIASAVLSSALTKPRDGMQKKSSWPCLGPSAPRLRGSSRRKKS